ncbi:MAG: hypothetical protein H6684_13870 [Deltaproteobacteria bacterium]|nr:hypothetical protein [bacterium]MCB9476965.1 hypothetical protein [Deltaproteobacteria bacterium]MCB9478654.1 hypothetical protein [Deltaproteobacteria bacterium]MCB9489815.1 hypothetical protein [Deltaproteobacteria bacterium]
MRRHLWWFGILAALLIIGGGALTACTVGGGQSDDEEDTGDLEPLIDEGQLSGPSSDDDDASDDDASDDDDDDATDDDDDDDDLDAGLTSTGDDCTDGWNQMNYCGWGLQDSEGEPIDLADVIGFCQDGDTLAVCAAECGLNSFNSADCSDADACINEC